MADGRHLEKMKNCNLSATDWRILTKFCMTVHLYLLQPVTNRRALEHRDATPCKISSKSVNPLRRYRDFSFFQDGGRRHVGFLKFSIWKFEFFTRLAWKRQFTPKNWGFGGNWSPLRLCCGYRPASDKLSNDLISTQSHNKLKHGLFTTIISPYIRIYAGSVPHVHGHKCYDTIILASAIDWSSCAHSSIRRVLSSSTSAILELWNLMQEKVYRSKIADVNEFKQVWSTSGRSLTNCRYQSMASSCKCLCPCTWGTL